MSRNLTETAESCTIKIRTIYEDGTRRTTIAVGNLLSWRNEDNRQIKAIVIEAYPKVDKTMNTLCPKQGKFQWTCTYEECTCHLKETIKKQIREKT